ncbi:hypothetical protein [Chondrinema litorale]|uniref:hypothetical protein n=1 Tax=Chondrinema litorale TaxID=2994555 RepID=UPI002542E4B5|nr:hypothetical protein [Chondrinema litorale]UZR95833.1 hypothetical protein OQ292_08405 [Chondrinema litorale]
MTHPNIIGNDQKSIKVCPECSHEITALSEKSRIFACPNCSSVFNSETNRRENQILGKNSTNKIRNITFLEVGQEFTFRKITYKITGQIRVKSNYKLVKNPNKTGTLIYDEWLCISTNNEHLRIGYDNIRYKIITPITPVLNKKPETKRFFVGYQKGKLTTEEMRVNEIIFFEGESENNLYPGKKFKCATYRNRYLLYLAEWEYDKSSKDAKPFIQEHFLEKDFIKIISRDNDISNYNRKIGNFKFFRKAINYTTLIVICCWLISLFYSGKTIYQKSFNLLELANEESIVAKEPLVIEDVASVYEFNLEAQLTEVNTEIYTGIEILNENQNVINLLGFDFWRAAGYDGGERWEESETDDSEIYSFPKKGAFTIVFHAEKSNLSRLNNKDKIVLKVNKGSLMSRYFIILLVICLFLLFNINNFTPLHNRIKKLFF